MRLKPGSLIAAAILFTVPTLVNAAYKFTALDGLGGASSGAYSINASGQIAGYSEIIGNASHATIWNGTTATDLGTLGGLTSYAMAINSAGQVAGYSRTTNGQNHAAIWNGTTATDLGIPGGTSQALGINDAGQVVGLSSPTNGGIQATLWNGTTMTVLGGDWANAINTSGQIAGRSANHAAVWNGTIATDLGTLGGTDSLAVDISDSGLVVGWSYLPNGNSRRAAFWNGTTVTDIGTLGSESVAFAINASSQVVGWSRMSNGTTHGFLWNGSNIIDVNSLLDAETINAGWVLTEANDINDNGWIVGRATNTLTSIQSAFLLTPVPEPETYAMMLAGLGLVSAAARRRA